MKSLITWSLIAAIVIPSAVVYTQSFEGSNATIAHQRLARELFQELIEINTTLNMGCTKAAEAMAARLRAAGFAENDVRLLGPQPLHMNLVVRYRGKGTLRPILLIGHLDVVEALRQDWSFDPFKFLESGGYFYGRGTTDMKCDDASLITNLIRLKQEGFVPQRDIIVALTEDEENGDANGVQWLLTNHRDLIDAEYCINPDGGGGDSKNGRDIVMTIQTSEKVYLDFKLEVHNKGGHSAVPVKENAIYRLAAALTRLAAYDFPINLNETTRMYFARSALQETDQLKADMLAMTEIPIDAAAANRLAHASPSYNSKMRTTCVATMLSGGHAENALPQTAQANINCRMLPDDSPENVLATLKTVVADTNVTIICTNASTLSPRSPLRKDVLETLDRLTASMWPGVIVTPYMSGGASDGRLLRAAGIPVYGISGMFTDMNDVRAHGKDERIGVNEFYKGIEFMYRFIKALTSGS
ncbi:MAG: M20/M25/M40 family metallo-hydrolase [Ignavibacteriales bacterium]|nr:M20/M25/M40 family metallo-hydrolase [Ignavibacteriales bacterium]